MTTEIKYDDPVEEIDLTDTATNVKAAPQATPRLGGFVLRNRFSGALAVTMTVGCVTGSDVDINLVTVLDVPKRTLVRGINLFAVESEAVPGHAFTYAGTSGSLASSDINADLTFIAQPYKNPTQASLDAVNASLTLGQILLTACGGSDPEGAFHGTPMVSIDSSTANATKTGIAVTSAIGSSNAVDAGAFSTPRYFPHGGKVLMALVGSITSGKTTELNQFSGVCSGVWEVQAKCQYVPE